MTSVRRLEHVSVCVEDVDRSVDFLTGTFGLVEFAREEGVVYLGCGTDGNYDLAVSEGGTGLDHLAVRARDRSVDEHQRRLEDHGISVTRTDGAEPGQLEGVRFDLPSGRTTMELVDVEDDRYHHPAGLEDLGTVSPVHPDRAAVAPRNLDHVGVPSPDIETDVEFLRDIVGFRVSDIGLAGDDDWHMAFTRAGQHHHDVVVFDDAVFDNPGCTLGHLAWDAADISHVKQLADHLRASGLELETPIVRHGPGSNLATYFKTPGGNRFEITTGVRTVDPAADVEYHAVREVPFCVWSGIRPPEEFFEGS